MWVKFNVGGHSEQDIYQISDNPLQTIFSPENRPFHLKTYYFLHNWKEIHKNYELLLEYNPTIKS